MRALGAVVAAVTIAGCGTAARPVSRERPATGQQLACSFAVDYTSLVKLRHDASSVAVVEPTGVVRTRVVSGIPMKDATVRVAELVAGKRLPSTFTLHDIVDGSVAGSQDCSPAVSNGNAYLLYLTQFRLRPKGPGERGRFVVVGGPQGAYVHAGTPPPADPAQRSFVHQRSDVGRSLPQRISIADARRAR
jgi:hypothetical protein